MSNKLDRFEKFNETIFLKNYNELDKQIQILKKLHTEYPDNEAISLKLKLCELGIKGEKEIEYELKNANIGMYVLHDINLNFDGNKAQIDYIVITQAFTYFIESKNLIGNITIDSNGQFIREYTYNNKKIKESIYSPVAQAERHMEIFKKIWNSRHSNPLYKIINVNLDNSFKSLVVMTNSKNILNLKYAPNDIKRKVIRADNLVNYIKKDIDNYNKDLLSSKKFMYKNAYSIMANYNQNISKNYEEEFRKLISNSRLNYESREEVKNKLLEFRNKKSLSRNIPPEYIFDNNELELILEKIPKTFDELQKENILSEVKLKYHGKEIIDIINKSYIN